MATPYVSSRSGRFQWMMQRVSAFLLIFLAFSHFGIQHFTSDAVSTGLTVAQRLNNPFWQGYYVMFIVLAMYHGCNGLMGILADYAPRRLFRGIVACIIWGLAFMFAAVGIFNIGTPKSVAEMKAHYTQNGFPKGDSSGSPPTPISYSYDATREIRELQLLAYYLEHHTGRSEATPKSIGDVFNAALNADISAGDEASADAAAVKSGTAFDTWALKMAASDTTASEERQRSMIFSNTKEYAIWALNVRKQNAISRKDIVTIKRLAHIPLYTPTLF